jgi:hypothetical protein
LSALTTAPAAVRCALRCVFRARIREKAARRATSETLRTAIVGAFNPGRGRAPEVLFIVFARGIAVAEPSNRVDVARIGGILFYLLSKAANVN